jgi:cobyrinic acid a,c-diamide synthase
VAGTGGDSGKTLVTLGLAAAWRQAGLVVSAFKKGPDYIDAAWLCLATDRPARNLDTWIMGEEGVRRSIDRHSAGTDITIVEGNRGILDGFQGHSTASLAKLIQAPVFLVIDVTKVTRTAAAFVAGVKALSPETVLAGVIANRVGGSRHAQEVKHAIEAETGVPVVGSIPRQKGPDPLPDRHLGLVPPEEHRRRLQVVQGLGVLAREHVDLERIFDLAVTHRATPDLPSGPRSREAASRDGGTAGAGSTVRAGVFRDSAFTFYYPENLEALEAAGAELVMISSLSDPRLPEIDCLYLGGGFPETHAGRLSANRSMLQSVRDAAEAGLPVYAECGGLIYLCRSVLHEGRRTGLSGVFDLDIEVHRQPQGHGYAEMEVSGTNPFFAEGTVLRGHEFHYAGISSGAEDGTFAFTVRRGAGGQGGRDGLTKRNVLATWLHLHALGTPAWASALVGRARRHAALRRTVSANAAGTSCAASI